MMKEGVCHLDDAYCTLLVVGLALNIFKIFYKRNLTQMDKQFYLLCFVCLLFSQSYAQKEANIWYFGRNAGLDFSSGSPVPLTNGAVHSIEGSATISDSAGNLLFYTDGMVVINANHNTMPNGTGLKGSFSSTQSSIIVPMPLSDSLFYIFTSDAGAYYQPPNEGIHYSLVDMSLDSGRGDVYLKNELLLVPAAEKLAAVHHCNAKDIWVVGHEGKTNQYYAWLVTSTGVNAPIISNIGTSYTDSSNMSLGQMNFSPNGEKIATVVTKPEANTVEIFDFNNEIGILSNYLSISVSGNLYGLSFSPDNSKLYITSIYILKFLMQLDLNAVNISSSKTIIDSTFLSIGGLQLATDGKIYLVKDSILGVINNPDSVGLACNYSDTGAIHTGKNNFFSLPGFIESYFYDSTRTYANYSVRPSICNNFEVFFTGDNGSLFCSTVSTYKWYFGDGDSADIQYPTHQYDTAGIYTVTFIVSYNNTYFDTVVKNVNATYYTKNVDFTYLISCLDNPTYFINSSICSTSTYKWNFGDGSAYDTTPNPSHIYTLSGIYNVTLVSTWDDGFIDSVTKSVTVLSDSGNAEFYFSDKCLGKFFFSDSSKGNPTNWLWDFGDGSPSDTNKNIIHQYNSIQGNYLVTLIVNYANGCQSDTISKTISFFQNFSAQLPAFACTGQPVQFKINYLTNLDTINYISWYISKVPSTITTDSFWHVFDTAGTYFVNYYFYYNNWACTQDSFYNLKVTDPPNAKFITFQDSGCTEKTITGVDSSTGNPQKWLWDFGDGTSIDTIQNSAHAYKDTGIYLINLIVIDTIGCMDTAAKPITVYQGVKANYIASDDTICFGNDIFFIDSSNGNPVSWLWNFGDSTLFDTSQNVSHNYTSAGTFNVTLIAGNNFSCYDTTAKPILISNLPESIFTLSNDTTCSNALVTFYDLSAGFPVKWFWNFGDAQVIDTIANPAHSYADTGTFIITQIIQNIFGCSDTTAKSIIIIPGVTANSSPDTSICEGASVNLSATGGINYSWQPTSFLSDPDSSSPIASPDSTITYTVTVSNKFCFDKDSTTVYLNKYPVQYINDSILCLDSTLILYAGNNSFNYYWSTGDTLQTMEVNKPGKYYVIVGKNDCKDTFNINVVLRSCKLKIPNIFSPNGDGINDLFPTNIDLSHDFDMVIYNRWGQEVFKNSKPNRYWDGIMQNTGRVVSDGVYYYIISYDDTYNNHFELTGFVHIVR